MTPLFAAKMKNQLLTEALAETEAARDETVASATKAALATADLVDYDTTFTGAGQTPPAMSVYQVSETGRRARQLFKPAERGAHVGEQFSFIGVQARPTGSGSNGPAHADIGHNVSIIKDGDAVGEIDGINVVVRQAGAASDACAILVDVAGWNGGTGFWGQLEGSTKHIHTDGTVLKDVRTQVGVIDTVNNSEFGFYAHAVTGTIDIGILLRSSGGVFTEYMRFLKDERVAFLVNGDGSTYVNAGALGSAQHSKVQNIVVESYTGNAIALHYEFNRHAPGNDWTTAEARMRLSVDNSNAPASSPWIAWRGKPGAISHIVFGFGNGAGSYDRVTIPVGGGIELTPVSVDPPNPMPGTLWHNSTTDEIKFRKNNTTVVIG